ncbi:S-adenosylhomocysteine hydrolase [Vibrio fluvialis]|nr:S-adenosylhomocysteine hydrolase [Vibrio fluvialis]
MTIAERVEMRIKRSKRDVYMRVDFSDLGSYSQVGKALRLMCAKEILIKIGYGVYAKARRNRINNRLMLAACGGSDSVLIEILDRLKIPYEFYGLTASYIEGSTTQIPASLEIKIKKRFSRKLLINNKKINVSN